MNSRNQVVALLAGITLAATATSVSAQPAGDLTDEVEIELEAERDTSTTKVRAGRRHGRMALEAAGILSIGSAWYWRRGENGRFGEPNEVDWQLGCGRCFDSGPIATKLGFGHDGWRFDGNSYFLNAVGHPMFGALTYFEARRNNYSAGESFLVSTLVSGAWEIFTEWAEYGSINDVLSTSTTGVPIGEAGYQLVTNWRKARYAITTGAGTQDGDGFVSLAGRAALDTTPTTGEGLAGAGSKVSVSIEVPFDGAVRAVEGGAKTSMIGYYKNGENYKVFAGASTEFYYRDQKDRDSREWDLLATINAGPTIDVQVRTGGVTIDVSTDAYAAFGMSKAAAYANWRDGNEMAVVRNSMQDKTQPYYYGRALTVDPRINVAYRGINVGGKLVVTKVDSLDGSDRDQEMLTADPHISDLDTSTEATAGYSRKGVTVAVDGRLHKRTGSMGDARGNANERTTMFTVSYQR